MLYKVTHCAGQVSANTEPHKLHWGGLLLIPDPKTTPARVSRVLYWKQNTCRMRSGDETRGGQEVGTVSLYTTDVYSLHSHSVYHQSECCFVWGEYLICWMAPIATHCCIHYHLHPLFGVNTDSLSVDWYSWFLFQPEFIHYQMPTFRLPCCSLLHGTS